MRLCSGNDMSVVYESFCAEFAVVDETLRDGVGQIADTT